MTTIVVPLDGSPFGDRALRPACSIAARLEDARVLLLSCAPDDIDVAQHHLDDRARLFSDVARVETHLVGSGDPAEVILATAATEPDGVVFLATHGRRGLRSVVLGGVAEQVVCRSRRPLVLVGPHCRTALLPAERGRLLMCSDGSAFSDSIVPTVATWCGRLGLEPWLTEVVGPDENPEPADRPHPNREVEAARTRLGKLASRFPSTLDPKSEVLHGAGAPGRAIADLADRLPAALVAMATHGRSGLTRLTMGSVATEVVRHAPCPVLLTRPPDTGTA